MATAFKQVKNGSKSTLAGDINDSVTSLSVETGEGSRFPIPGNSYWATIWDKETFQDARDDPDGEVVLVTARSSDSFTITRAQLGSSASSHSDGDAFEMLLVDQHLIDLYDATNARVEKAGDTMTGSLTLSGAPSSSNHAANKQYVDDLEVYLQGQIDDKVDDTALTDALPTTVGTNGQVLKSNGSAVTWQTDANTTYTEISTAEIDAGTSSTTRSITARRVKYAQDATKAVYVSSSAPTDTNKFWLDTTADATSTQANADTVDGFHANATPTANTIPVLDGSAKLPEDIRPITYSLSEVDTGDKWVDGKAIYRKTIDIGTLPNATTKDVSMGVTIERLVRLDGSATTGSTTLPLPMVSDAGTSATNQITVFILTQNTLRIGAGTNRSAYNGLITVWYTKP